MLTSACLAISFCASWTRLTALASSPASPSALVRASVSTSGVQANRESEDMVISADGNCVAFSCFASNLVAGDTNGYADMFVHDMHTGFTTRVSVSSNSVQADDNCWQPSLSADGRYVAFGTTASTLVPGDSNGKADVFVRDRQTGTTTLESVSSSGAQGNNDSYYPSISADGRYVAFFSYASNLVQGDGNGFKDVFVHDRQTGITTRVSISSAGAQGNGDSRNPSISADGRYVAFGSEASNLVQGDTNGTVDVFVHDNQTGATTRVSVSSSGEQGNGVGNINPPSISADGRYVAFEFWASNLVQGDNNGFIDVFVHDCQTGTTSLASVASWGDQGSGPSAIPAISPDGRFVAFTSWAYDLVEGDDNEHSDVFVHDQQTGATTRVSLSSSGGQGNGDCYPLSISAYGKCVAFVSGATNLVPGDTNGREDVFVHTGTLVVSPIRVAPSPRPGNLSLSSFIAGNGPGLVEVARRTHGFPFVVANQKI